MMLVFHVAPRLVVKAKRRPGTIPSMAAATTMFEGLTGLMATQGSVSFPFNWLRSTKLVPTEKGACAKAAGEASRKRVPTRTAQKPEQKPWSLTNHRGDR